MNSGNFDLQFIHLDSIDSTNIYALELLRDKKGVEGMVVHSDFQKKGKGQLGSLWQSDRHKNLLFSLILSPKIELENQFQLSKIISLGIKNYLDTLAVGEVNIKWPNDILVEQHKIAGILIENSVTGSLINHSVVGIGLNLNQVEFDRFERQPTSLKLLKGNQFVVEEELKKLCSVIFSVYEHWKDHPHQVDDDYVKNLYGYGKPLKLEDKDGVFLGVILSVLPNGHLQLNRNGKLRSYDLKDIKFLE
jgi:BirA family biotin operon repressor/biotin-[acetyl-CoA-carboxylase] ligase